MKWAVIQAEQENDMNVLKNLCSVCAGTESMMTGNTGSYLHEREHTDIYSSCRLIVRKNGAEIYNRTALDNTLIYSGVIDMPAGHGHMTLEFSVSAWLVNLRKPELKLYRRVIHRKTRDRCYLKIARCQLNRGGYRRCINPERGGGRFALLAITVNGAGIWLTASFTICSSIGRTSSGVILLPSAGTGIFATASFTACFSTSGS